MVKLKLNEIEKIVRYCPVGFCGDGEADKWLRRKLRALVRRAYLHGRLAALFKNDEGLIFKQQFGVMPQKIEKKVKKTFGAKR